MGKVADYRRMKIYAPLEEDRVVLLQGWQTDAFSYCRG
jgi:hypothetical protein